MIPISGLEFCSVSSLMGTGERALMRTRLLMPLARLTTEQEQKDLGG